MGEMADFTNSCDGHWGYDSLLYRYGGLKRCRNCGAGGLHWAKLDSGKFWLHDTNGTYHRCKQDDPAGLAAEGGEHGSQGTNGEG